jgi:hypothetical protein
MRLFSLILIFYSIAVATAQTRQADDLKIPRHQVKFSLLDVIDPVPPSLLFSYEQPFLKNYALIAEGGPVVAFDGREISGIKLRGEVRWYDKPTSAGDRLYLGLNLMHKRYTRFKSDTFCRDNCAYYQELDYTLDSKVTAAHLSLGLSIMAGPHFVIDLGAMGGWRVADRSTGEVPEDASLVNENDFILFEQIGHYSYPSVGFVCRLGFGW